MADLNASASTSHLSGTMGATDASLGAYCRVRDHFTKRNVVRDPVTGAPTARFGITDFPEPLDYNLIEDMADAMLVAAPIASGGVDMLVSIADRCGGAITHALAQRTGLPYTLANWYPMGSPGEVEIGQCAGFSGDGVVYLNGLKRGKTVAIVGDILKSGATINSLLKGVRAAGCHVQCIVVAAELVEPNGRASIDESIPILPVVRIHVRGELTKEAADIEGKTLPNPTPEHLKVRPNTTATSKTHKNRITEIKSMSQADLTAKTERIHAAFVGIPIVRNELLSYPYSFFNLTDFTPALEPSWIEDLADLCVYHGNFEKCDVVVSECDRGGGPMIQAICNRVDKPFVLANWYPSIDGCGMSSHVQIGFSGQGNIVVNGLKAGDRCIIVDDMLSSGGTCDGILNSIVKLGAIPTVGIFASEKLYPASERTPTTSTPPPANSNGFALPWRKGALRLRKQFPYFEMISICQFIAEGDRTVAPSTWIGDDTLLCEEQIKTA